MIQTDATLSRDFKLLQSIKGVSVTSAVHILAELCCMPDDLRVEQWVAFAGLDPRHCQSGTSVNKPSRISKSGNKYLRTALYMPALVAVNSEPSVKAFYDHLIERDKCPMQALVATMRKILHAIFGMLKTGTVWDESKFFHRDLEESPS